ncbi:hypothetical protein Vadar_031549 [Vaccinium darrowii]|uniref:Uncharacterized protein n=1 Tax=Vaccinium darrowii TaxID=229202 RepID=A0ACB7YHK8_9ERIC|nr:hypothetical protein Vadar_031549 [Vaccinium darrowii]
MPKRSILTQKALADLLFEGSEMERVFDAKGQLIVMWAASKRILKDQMPKDPAEVVYKSILRMLPRNKLRVVMAEEAANHGLPETMDIPH